MIKLKTAFGNGVKCKLEPEYMISQYELGVLNAHPLNGLFKVQADKGGGILFQGNLKRTLGQLMKLEVRQEQLLFLAGDLIHLVADLRKLGLEPERLILHPDWIFQKETQDGWNFLYCPVNGADFRFDSVLFLRDITASSRLAEKERTAWNQWLTEAARKGITERSQRSLEQLFSQKKPAKVLDKRTVREELEEAPTGMDEERSYGVYDDDGEALTGVDEEYDILEPETGAAEYEIEEETPTGVSSPYINDAMDKGDGTFLYDSPSESRSLSGRLPVLTRVSTGERMEVTGNEFKIGRSAQRVQFRITGNSGVSNVHATIIKKGNTYYLKDNHSTNGTSVDGIKVGGMEDAVPLRNGSRILIWNEELIFNL